MWAKKTQTGFTIVETLIVLAVTGVMFLSTVTLISGQISKRQFRSGAYQLQTLVKDKINDVSSGYYPDLKTSAAACSVSPSGKDPGTNTNCDIIGKRLVFGTNSVSVSVLSLRGTTVSPIGPETYNYPMSLTKTSAGSVTIDIRNQSGYAQLTDTGGNPLTSAQTLCFDNAAQLIFPAGGATDAELKLGVSC